MTQASCLSMRGSFQHVAPADRDARAGDSQDGCVTSINDLAARIPECVIISALDSNLTPLG